MIISKLGAMTPRVLSHVRRSVRSHPVENTKEMAESKFVVHFFF